MIINSMIELIAELNDAAILSRCYTQHTLRPYIDLEIIIFGILSKSNLSIKELSSLTFLVYNI